MSSVATLQSSSSLHRLGDETRQIKRIKLQHQPRSNSSSSTLSMPSMNAEEQDQVVSPEHHPSSNDKKATSMEQLHDQYYAELEYMLVEFQKLERQLLVARSAATETEASRERREKLHSFIQHLQETMRDISKGVPDRTPEDVAKLQEHILTNLLPVKNRLKKQLAAQKGARHNPAGMPRRVGYNTEPTEQNSQPGTFAQAAHQRKQEQQQEKQHIPEKVDPEDTQFGKPLQGGGSSLTQKLHGSTLGSSDRKHGHGVGTLSESQEQPKKLVAGLAIGSDQGKSAMAAASSVHQVVIKEPALLEMARNKSFNFFSGKVFDSTEEMALLPQMNIESLPELNPSILSEDEKERLRKKKRKLARKRKAKVAAKPKSARPHSKTNAASTSQSSNTSGPRSVEYMCSLCNEVYTSTCDYNPWWALSRHECPKCQKVQIPRLDIGAPANAIEYHPALLAHIEDNASPPPPPPEPVEEEQPALDMPESADAASTDSSVTEDLDNISTDDDEAGSDEADDDEDDDDDDSLEPMSLSEQAELERFGAEYSGPTLDKKQAAQLLVLMEHASACACNHKSPAHREVCLSTKYMMLHVRDCPGTTFAYDVCPFPWCRKVKHLLYHLVSCREPTSCEICAPTILSENLQKLKEMNEKSMIEVREMCKMKGELMLCAQVTSSENESDSKLVKKEDDESF